MTRLGFGILSCVVGLVLLTCLCGVVQTRSLIALRGTPEDKSVVSKPSPGLGDHLHDPLHILVSVSGNSDDAVTATMKQFDVLLKSLLLNAPLHADMHIHIIGDSTTMEELRKYQDDRWLTQWPTIQAISINLYSADPFKKKWTGMVQQYTRNALEITDIKESSVFRNSIGAYYRLFADEILDAETIPSVLYMDTDLAITANLDSILPVLDEYSNHIWSWGKTKCSGFMHFHVAEIPLIWELYAKAPDKDIQDVAQPPYVKMGDQHILRVAEKAVPDRVGALPPEWDGNIMDSPRHHETKARVFEGDHMYMMHMNGYGGGTYWESHKALRYKNAKSYNESWRLILYYVHLPWKFALGLAKAQCTLGKCHTGVTVRELAPKSFRPTFSTK